MPWKATVAHDKNRYPPSISWLDHDQDDNGADDGDDWSNIVNKQSQLEMSFTMPLDGVERRVSAKFLRIVYSESKYTDKNFP